MPPGGLLPGKRGSHACVRSHVLHPLQHQCCAKGKKPGRSASYCNQKNSHKPPSSSEVPSQEKSVSEIDDLALLTPAFSEGVRVTRFCCYCCKEAEIRATCKQACSHRKRVVVSAARKAPTQTDCSLLIRGHTSLSTELPTWASPSPALPKVWPR